MPPRQCLCIVDIRSSPHLLTVSPAPNGAGGDEIVSLLDSPGWRPDLGNEDLWSLYEWMVRLRVFDQRLTRLHRQGRIAFLAASTGEEASMIGTAFALGPEDWVFPAYREQGVALYRGYPLDTMLCQIFGNSGDPLRGRQMPNHYGSSLCKVAVVSSPVGTQIPHAVGAAWASRLQGESGVAAVYFGDGATSTGDFHAGMNQAAVAGLPVVFFCRNNGWAISVAVERQTAVTRLSDKAAGYGMPALRVDGNDILAVHSVARQALAEARKGGPVFVELITRRMGPHSTADDDSRYRDAAERDKWALRDPILRYRTWLEARGLWKPDDEQRIEANAEEWFTEALAAAEKLPPPEAASLIEDVYARTPWHLKEQLQERLEDSSP